MTLGEPDAGGRRRPVAIPDSAFALPADTAVKAIGQRPREELAAWIGGVTFENGLLKIDEESGQTDNPKFFAGGDVANGGASVVEAVAAAKRAAKGIDVWLRQM